ncbi:hypothetical protein PSECIP111951_03576 [Pseudoalteromonas holothuriae]|uniref:Fatty acid desaturase domain-containing protein n=1 Tax=Pseudoalteromonas holothuriae TaxID=2963714 RepID=A0ABN8UQF6_9GAMM|nr:fatty acid desaturase [Pseudoalteromonas sp. CIP111951]CAH9066443.1 hypothetical protein PSECIP111951_03576 [Pseudoalteromonas sp. CIP111951]
MHPQQTRQNIKNIITAITEQEQHVRNKYGILKYQNHISIVILLFSLFGMLSVGLLYIICEINGWVAIFSAAFFASISHELEHDLIHRQYFKSNPLVHNMMMLIVWLMRPNTISPWYRRRIHLHHHKVSGTEQDIEERLVGNGIKNPLLRVLVISDGLLGLILQRRRYQREINGFSFFCIFNAGFPIATCNFLILYFAIIFHCFDFISNGRFEYSALLNNAIQWVDTVMVILILPNLLRSFCLNLITSSMHYYGGVNNVLQQTQVLNHWLLFPFQLFCFNFGVTHTIHHFVPNQPFYIRQLIAKRILPVLKQNNVRFNDFESLKNANLYSPN